MAEKVWAVGDILSASDLNTWTLPLTGVKSANQTIISQTSYVNDADMRITVATNAIYDFNCFVIYDSGTGQDLKMSFTAPSGSDCTYMCIRNNLSNNFGDNLASTAASNVGAIGGGVGTNRAAVLLGTLFTTTTGGLLIFQWAQNTSGAFNTTLHQYSRLTARRIG